MQRHALFEFYLHDDKELEAVLGSPVVRRVTLHEWPLSCVQGIECASGQRLIYKAQAPPTVEPDFYQQARSPILVKAQVLPVADAPSALLLEVVPAPRLCDHALLASRGISITDELLGQISQIQGELPALDDIRSRGGWMNTVSIMQSNLQALADSGNAPQITPEVLDAVGTCSRSAAIYAALDTRHGYVHFNLSGSNVLMPPDGFRVIDWQRPIWGPVALDKASLLESLGIDPRPHVLPGILQLNCLLLIGWYAASARFWFPKAAPWLLSEIVRLAKRLLPDAPPWVPIVPQLLKTDPLPPFRDSPGHRVSN